MPIIRRLDRIAGGLSLVLAVLAGVFLVATMLLACANMILRAAAEPIPGTVELVGFFGAVLTAFSLGFTQRKRGHIHVGLLAELLPKPLQRITDALHYLVSSVFFALAAEETVHWGLDLIHTGELSQTLRIPYYPFVFTAAFGCLTMAFVLLVDFLKTLLPQDA